MMSFLQHIYISGVSIVLCCFIGVPLGIFISEKPKYVKWVMTITNIIYTIPSIAMFGVLIAITGLGNTTAIIAMVIYGVLPVLKNTYTGLNGVDKMLIKTAVAMGSSQKQVRYKIKLPLSFPVIIAGIRNMAVMTVALTGIASFVGAGGLGVPIWRGITTNNQYLIIIGSVLVALLAFVTDFALGKLEKRINLKYGMG